MHNLRKEDKGMKKTNCRKVSIKKIKMPKALNTCQNPSNCH